MIFGWDQSHYDSPIVGNALNEGISFITHKAGGDANDPEIGAWWAGVRDYRDRLIVGAYWVLYPGNPAGRADAFLARLDATCPGWRDGPFILQLDCEIWNGSQATKPGRDDIKAACDRLAAQMPKLRPIVYASAGQYGNSLAGLGYPLWNARYPSSMTGPVGAIYQRVGGDSGSGWAAYSGQTPAVWQFSSSATIAGQPTSDANAFRGTLDDLMALVAPGWVDDMQWTDKPWGSDYTAAVALQRAYQNSAALVAAVASLTTTVAAMAKSSGVDEQAIVTGILTALNPQQIALAVVAALPADEAKKVVDELTARLAG